MRDPVFILAGTVVCLAALVYGATRAAADHETRESQGRFASRQVLGANTPTQLPPGVRIDPATGLMIGVRLSTSEGVTPVPWETLRAYEYQEGLVGLPETIRALDGKQIAMLGFLWPVYEYDDIDEFGLVGNHWSCCYGIPPGLSDVVDVKLRDDQPGLSPTLNPMRVEGTFHVKEIKREGFTMAIYSMTDAVATVIEY